MTTTEKIYSKVYDKDIKKHLSESPIWKACEHSEDIHNMNVNGWYEYAIKFDGLMPIQCTNIKKI